jgi:hypothetical protein
MRKPKFRDHVAELEDELKQRDAHIKELRADVDKAHKLVSQMREHVEDANRLIVSWVEAFELTLNDKGEWSWASWVETFDALHSEHEALVREWNAAVADFNSVIRPRKIGRPLAASEAQRVQVLKLHKGGTSLRGIAEETGLGVRTVRTIIDQGDGGDRTTVKYLERIHPDRKRETPWRARKRARDGLPKHINATLEKGRKLVKEAKGPR